MYISIQNNSDFKIDFLKSWAQKLKPYFGLVEKSAWPFKVIVKNKKDFFDRSSFDLGNNTLVLKINMNKQSEEEIAWVFIHEFAHFLCNNNAELEKTCLAAEYDALEKILQNVFNLDRHKVNEIFHDFLPPEVAANMFATMLVGKFYKRHSFKNVEKIIGKIDATAKKITKKIK